MKNSYYFVGKFERFSTGKGKVGIKKNKPSQKKFFVYKRSHALILIFPSSRSQFANIFNSSIFFVMTQNVKLDQIRSVLNTQKTGGA